MNPSSGSADGFPWAAIATILAAGVTGIFAAMQLIISKENKISEFRHEWINGLRTDLADYVASTRLYAELHLLKRRVQEQRMGSLFQEAMNAQTRVQLRLRPVDKDHPLNKAVADKMEEVREAVGKTIDARGDYLPVFEKADAANTAILDAIKANNPALIAQAQQTHAPLQAAAELEYQNLHEAVEATKDRMKELRELAGPVLDAEWMQVKKGEKNYRLLERLMSILATVFVAGAVAAALWYLAHERLHWF